MESDRLRYALLIAVGLLLVLAVMAGWVLSRPAPVPVPATPTATFPAPPTLAPSATPTARPTRTPRPTATVTQPVDTATPPMTATPTVAPTATPDLKGHHRVAPGETMYGIALLWEPGRFFAWAEDVWRPVCDVNPDVVDCRLIYPGDVLRIPQR